jgi:hypothetical protein
MHSGQLFSTMNSWKHTSTEWQSSAVMVFGDVFTLVYLPILQTILKSNYSPLQNGRSERLIRLL